MVEISEDYVDEIVEKSRTHPRGRVAGIMHPGEHEGLRVLVNAIQPVSYIRPHLHESYEAFGALRGKFDVFFFDEEGDVTDRFDLGRNYSFIEIPERRFHTILAGEEDSVLLDMSMGPYNPDEFKRFAEWAPEEPEGGVGEYGNDIREFMKKLRG